MKVFLIALMSMILIHCGQNQPPDVYVQPPIVQNTPPEDPEYLASCQDLFGRNYVQTWVVSSWVTSSNYVDLLQTNGRMIRISGSCNYSRI